LYYRMLLNYVAIESR